MTKYKIAFNLERSTNGGHRLWVFTSEPVGLELFRDALKVITAEAGHPSVEIFPKGNAQSNAIYLPYRGADLTDNGLGYTNLERPDGTLIPLGRMLDEVRVTSIEIIHELAHRINAKPPAEEQPTQTPRLVPAGYEALKQAALTPPSGFARHDSIEGFLNVAERMGKGDEMADYLKSADIYSVWVMDGSRTTEAWAAEIDRWRAGTSIQQFGLKSLLDQGWQLPNLPKLGEALSTAGGKIGQRNALMEAFKAMERKYAPQTINAATGIDELLDFGFDNLDDLPTSEPLVENMLIKRSLCALTGKSGAGKNMIALDVALHVVLGQPWAGRKVEQGGVAWIAAEGIEETADRMEAWRDLHGKQPRELANFRVLNAPSKPLTDVQPGGGLEQMILGLKRIEAKTGPLALIVVDTVSRTYGVGMEENDNNDMVFYTNCAELLTRAFHCTVWLLHHQGKGNSGEARGASAFNAPMEAITAIEKKTGYFDLTTVKMRSGPGETVPVPLRLVTREIKRGGKVRGVGVVDHSAIAVGMQFMGPELLPEQQYKVYQALEDLCLSDTVGVPSKPVKRTDWVDLCRERHISDSTIKDSIRQLVKLKFVLDLTKGEKRIRGPYLISAPEPLDT